ncbi:hypothetical protein [Sorangium sp. So ce1000]|uniref:hypothetical protein n=1 Tax=Sorangium sp. So ce1000 TaxID=3133325 RepID=UPI003F5D7811
MEISPFAIEVLASRGIVRSEARRAGRDRLKELLRLHGLPAHEALFAAEAAIGGFAGSDRARASELPSTGRQAETMKLAAVSGDCSVSTGVSVKNSPPTTSSRHQLRKVRIHRSAYKKSTDPTQSQRKWPWRSLPSMAPFGGRNVYAAEASAAQIGAGAGGER